MYNLPSRRKTKRAVSKLNLIPILDAVFIFIFFLLVSSNFIKIYEIASDVPIVSYDDPPPKEKKPLALTLKINQKRLEIYTGVPAHLYRKIDVFPSGNHDLNALHSALIDLKQKHTKERTIIFEPVVDIEYNELVTIMDSVRVLKNTDPTIYKKDKDGIKVKEKFLFDNIVFGNIQS